MVSSVPPNSSVALSDVGRDGRGGSHDLIGNGFQWCRYRQGELNGQSRGVEVLGLTPQANFCRPFGARFDPDPDPDPGPESNRPNSAAPSGLR